MIKIGILSSYNGSGYISIKKACEDGILNAKIVLVISNNSDANVLKDASSNDIPNFTINQKKYPDEDLDEKITNLMLEYNCDYIFLSGYMKKLGQKIVSTYENKIINSHPALLPNFGGKGMYGRFVHEAVVKAKAKQSGVTIHYVNNEYDKGEFILQNRLDIKENESVDSVENRVKELELSTIVEAFKTFC